jgi:hypothetical protein
MPRRYRTPVTKLAMSPSKLSAALDLRYELMASAIKSGELPVYIVGIKRRVLVSDAEQWLRSHPELVQKVSHARV